jgi:hypothetical protein
VFELAVSNCEQLLVAVIPETGIALVRAKRLSPINVKVFPTTLRWKTALKEHTHALPASG